MSASAHTPAPHPAAPASTPPIAPRALLVRGLLVGLLAGLVSFGVSAVVGEPTIDAAIAYEESVAPAPEPGAPAEDELVSRGTQATWGLGAACVAVGGALGGLVALGAALAIGRLGRLDPTRATAVVAAVGFVAVALVPWLAFPANPPGVGDPGTIGSRTLAWFGLLDVSVLTALAAVVVAVRLATRLDAYAAGVLAAAGYLVVVLVTVALLPDPAPLGDVPAQVLWDFRLASLLTLATLWGVLGVGLVGTVRRLQRDVVARAERRALAASL